MNLVMVYNTFGNEECGCEHIVYPIRYDSAEALICDFENALDAAKEAKQFDFRFGNRTFSVKDFFLSAYLKDLPQILTVEEWFEQEDVCP